MALREEGCLLGAVGYRMPVWNRENNCAYYERIPDTSDVNATEKEWTHLWQVKVPSKLRVFLWRLARCSSPSGDVLHHRDMAPSDVCSIFGAKDSWKYSLIECNMSKCVWALEKEGITDFIGALQEEDARAWLANVLSSLPHEERVRVVVTLWAIWHARRKVIHENIFQEPLSTRDFIDRSVTELGMTTTTPGEAKQCGRSPLRWIPPPVGLVNINVDATVSKNSDQAALAAIARDVNGIFIGPSAVVSFGITDPESLEAMACQEGLSLAGDTLLR
jgi:hypothetical protein